MKFTEYIELQNRITSEIRGSTAKKMMAPIRGIRDAVLSDFYRAVRRGGEMSLDDIEALARSAFRVTKTDSAKLRTVLESGMETLAKARRSIIDRAGIGTPVMEYEDLMAAYGVDLPQLNKSARRQAVNAWRKTIGKGRSFRDMERILLDSDIVEANAYTQATTALAQFDNDYTVSLGREAGIKKYHYTGAKAERAFCVKHLGNDYTIEEIERMDNGQGLPVLTSCGGWRCQHTLTPNPFAK